VAEDVPDAGAALTPFAPGVPVLAAAGEVAEPDADLSVVEVGPATPPEVSDVVTFEDVAVVVEPVLLLFAAEAEFVPLPLQATAAAARAIETRTERYIFPSWYQQ
jgi:hypothetical protein